MPLNVYMCVCTKCWKNVGKIKIPRAKNFPSRKNFRCGFVINECVNEKYRLISWNSDNSVGYVPPTEHEQIQTIYTYFFFESKSIFEYFIFIIIYNYSEWCAISLLKKLNSKMLFKE